VFGIGLNKTGTSSLHRALTLLGWHSLHWGGPPVRRLVETALAEGRPLLEGLDPGYDAFSDIEPVYRNFDVADAQYPGSRFVLTVRPIGEWVDSRRRHVLRNRQRKEAGEYHGAFLEVDEDGWRADWHQHVERVHRHFAGRDAFIEVDLTRQEGWGAICGLLAVPEPDLPFPWENRDHDGREAG
jgi:hypothetical protein